MHNVEMFIFNKCNGINFTQIVGSHYIKLRKDCKGSVIHVVDADMVEGFMQ